MDVSRETAEIFFNEGRYGEAVSILELIANEQAREYGPNSGRTLQTRTRIAEIFVVQEKYVEALTLLLDIYRRKFNTRELKHLSSVDTRQRIKNLLLKHGSLDVMSAIMQDIVKTLKYLMKMIRKKYLNGQYELALKEGGDILDDMTEFLGEQNPITLDMACLIAIIRSSNEDYCKPLETINDIYEKKKLLVGSMDIRMVSIVMMRASIYLKMCSFEEAMNCYIEAYSIRKLNLGHLHRKTLVTLRYIAEVSYTVGNYENALSILTEIARIQKFHKYKELILTKIHIGILEFARGNYEDALLLFRNILIKKRTPKHIRAMIQNKKGVALVKLGRYHEARIILKDACDIMKLTDMREETLRTYRNLAVLLAKEGKAVTAEAMLIILVATSAVMLNPRHSVVFSIENDLAEFWLSRGKFKEALRVFMKLWTFQNDRLGACHPATLHAKCQVAKIFKEQGNYDEALRLYNEALIILKAHYYSQHLDCLDIQNRIASIYLCRNLCGAAFQIYYKIYKIIADNYEADHPFVIEMIERMQNLTDRVPLRRIMEAILTNNIDAVRTFVENGDDIYARDVNGAVALHYASRTGNIPILTYLLSKGAIYDIEDMFGNTPESVSANDETKFVFLLVKRLFECAENDELENTRRILLRERLIINARDSACHTPLHRAIINGHFEIVQELVSQGADLSFGTEDDGSILHMAADRGRIYILEVLLWHLRTTDLDLFRLLIDSTDNVLGVTPLHVAAKKNRQECVETLIYYLANPMITDLLGKYPYDMGPHEMQQLVLDYSFRFYNMYQEYNRVLLSEV